jgi:uncharacterized protein involved in outer membrane biogenesis
MLKKLGLGVLGLVLALVAALYFWGQSVLASDAVKTTLATQISSYLGQPVTIGSLSASVYPRVSITLNDVTIGTHQEIHAARLAVGTDFRALLSRRIEHAALRLDSPRVTLPLPAFAIPDDGGAADPNAKPAVELVSIDAVVLSGVEVVSGGRVLKGDIEVVPQGNGVEIRKVTLTAGAMTVTATGHITDLNGPVGEIALNAGALDFDELIAFANDFASGSGAAASAPPARAAAAPAAPTAMNIRVSVQADTATMGGLTLNAVSSKAALTSTALIADPIQFGLFGGKYDGTLHVGLGDKVPTFRWKAAVSNIDVAAATAFAGSPNLVSGKLSGSIALEGQGADAASAMKTIHGRTQIEIANGVVKNLGLVRAAVAATSLSLDGAQRAFTQKNNSDEPFSRLGGTIELANMTATTKDLHFDAADLSLAAAGTIRLDASTIDMAGRVQLSEALTSQGNATVAQLTSDKGRMTLPATITGTFAAPSVKIDAGNMAKRAVANVAKQQTDKAKERGKQELTKRLGFLGR